MRDHINKSNSDGSGTSSNSQLSIINVTARSLYNRLNGKLIAPSNDLIQDFTQSFSNSLKVLILGARVQFTGNQLIEFNDFKIPSTVETLYIGEYFDLKLVSGMIPDSVTELTLSYDFVYDGLQLKDITPKSLLSLTFPSFCRYKLQMGDLNEPLQTLDLGMDYVKNVEFLPGLLPSSLKYLNVGTNFGGILNDGSLPEGLETFILPSTKGGTNELPKLPISLKHLKYQLYPSKVKFCLNPTPCLISLEILSQFIYFSEFGYLPNTLKKLVLPGFNSKIECGMLPDSIEELKLHKFNQRIEPNTLPKNLKKFELWSFNHELSTGSLPAGLETLVLDNAFNQRLYQSNFPSTLKFLKFGSNYKVNIEPYTLPISLDTLEMSTYQILSKFEISHCCNLTTLKATTPLSTFIINGSLPKSLKTLHTNNLSLDALESGQLEGLETLIIYSSITSRNNQRDFTIEPNCFPSTLQYLQVGLDFDAIFSNNSSLPKSLRIFKLNYKYNKKLPKNLLPPSLLQLCITPQQKDTILGICKIPLYCTIIHLGSL
ncbi:hypothetical protein DLAC_11511 [Tieghemostelium lacteum]|uniref:Calmodulin-binding protein n=1 Tax=Tieghemostelium lacteum TaxID=361077 RepID=A0A152A506_TIELA|nr:hypothetical protein DLAC_11511 [Tieghemostelium lacteum]|eukprot:KYR01323.1 hypothetical protein DLAC_11511 [Tieghemostelium lacteum]